MVMKFLIALINTIIYFLSLIGNFVLLYINFFLRRVKRVKKYLSRFYKKIGRKYSKTIENIDKFSKLATFRAFLSFKLLKSRLAKSKKPKSKKRQKEITVYPTPRNIFTKFKYFTFGFLVCFVLVFIPFSFYFLVNSLPNPKNLSIREIPQTTKIYDRNGKLLYQIYANENRTLVPLSQLPKDLVNATIAIEDKEFYKNPGFDIQAIGRAAIADISGKPIQGGSTITQQLIKSTLLTPEVSFERKFKEIILAFWAERIYTKNQILEMYFNQVSYGGTSWGVEAAAETYFGKSVNNLDLAQSAFLAGMPQAPSAYSPYGQNPNLWKKRQLEVLKRMSELSFITGSEQREAMEEELIFRSSQTPIYAPHFVMYVKELLVKKYGLPLVEKGGLNVITSLDLNIQNMAQDVVREEVDNDWYLNLTNGAALVTNPKNGDILAMVGSKDYNDSNGGNVNLTTSLRQPGSSIKIVTYSAALSNGFTAATILDDSPITYRNAGSMPYSPVNYDGLFHGKVPLRIAFANSLNVPAVKTLARIGIPTMVEMGKNMGITTWGAPENYGLSITLGAAEVKMVDLATVFGTVANLGKKVELNPILKVTNRAGEVLYHKDDVVQKRVLDPAVAYIISNILSDNAARSMEFGPNSPLNIQGHVVSVKTGTTDNKRDNWTLGFTPAFLVGVWVGNNDNSPMSQYLASGITGAAPIWHKIMENLLSNANYVPQIAPENIVRKKCGQRIEYFVRGTENLSSCYYIATLSAQPL